MWPDRYERGRDRSKGTEDRQDKDWQGQANMTWHVRLIETMWPYRYGRGRDRSKGTEDRQDKDWKGQAEMTGLVRLIETDHNVAGQVVERETGARGQRTGRTRTGRYDMTCTVGTLGQVKTDKKRGIRQKGQGQVM